MATESEYRDLRWLAQYQIYNDACRREARMLELIDALQAAETRVPSYERGALVFRPSGLTVRPTARPDGNQAYKWYDPWQMEGRLVSFEAVMEKLKDD